MPPTQEPQPTEAQIQEKTDVQAQLHVGDQSALQQDSASQPQQDVDVSTADAAVNFDDDVAEDDHALRANLLLPAIQKTPSSSTISSFKSVISSASSVLRRSPRKASKPVGWYSELHDFDDDY